MNSAVAYFCLYVKDGQHRSRTWIYCSISWTAFGVKASRTDNATERKLLRPDPPYNRQIFLFILWGKVLTSSELSSTWYSGNLTTASLFWRTGTPRKKSSLSFFLSFLSFYHFPRMYPFLQDPSEINGDNLNGVRHEANRHFRNIKQEIWKTKLMSLQRTVRTSSLDTWLEE
jgi:hypothetical protein